VSNSFLLIIFRVTLPCVVHSLIRAPPNGGSLKQKVLCPIYCIFEKVEYVAFVQRTRRKKKEVCICRILFDVVITGLKFLFFHAA
jgi:hypothetical protein